jgi:N-acyl-D-amino-acid deacylase
MRIQEDVEMAYDLVIKNGTVIDGTGAFRRRADVAVQDGKVAEIGKVTDGAKETIDASDLIVSPGFVDRILTTMRRSAGIH